MIITLYVIFCITTAILIMKSVVIPAIDEAWELEPKPSITRSNKMLVYIGFTVTSLLFAPAMFAVYMEPSWNLKFRDMLDKDLRKL